MLAHIQVLLILVFFFDIFCLEGNAQRLGVVCIYSLHFPLYMQHDVGQVQQ